MSFLYPSPYSSPFVDLLGSISDAVSQAQQQLAQDPTIKAAKKAYLAGEDPTPILQKGLASKEAALDKQLDSAAQSYAATDPFLNGEIEKYLPKIDIKEKEDSYKLRVSLPGALKDKLQVEFNKDTNELTVKGELPSIEDDETDSEGHVVHTEIPQGRFERTLSLPKQIDGEAIKANYTDGILTLNVPKIKDGQNVHSIQIEGTTEVDQ